MKLDYEKWKKLLKFYLDNPLVFYHRFRGAWKYTISLFIAWMITNGWAYALAFMGNKVAIAYITLLWMPFTPEKIITLPISFFLHKLIWHENGDEDKQRTKILIDLAIIGQ